MFASRRSMFLAAAATALLSMGIAAPIALTQSKEMPLTASAEAKALFLKGWAKAENLEDPGTLFDEAVQKDPNFAFGYLYAGHTNLDARRNLEKAVSLAAKASPAEREWILAVAAANDGDQATAAKHYDELLKLAPNDKRVLEQLGNYYRNQGDDAAALKYFEQATKLDKNYAPAYNDLGYA